MPRVALTPKRRDFCRFYVQHEDAKKAALDAGYSQKYAEAKAFKLPEVPEIAAEIKRLRSRLNERAEKSAVDVINGFSTLAFTDRVSFLKPDPERPGEYMYKAPNELTEDQRQCVETVKMYTAEIIIIEGKEKKSVFRQEYIYVFSDKAKALEQMGRHFGIFDDKLRIGVSANNPFKNVTPAQLEKLQASWISTMGNPQVMDGEYKVLKHEK